MLHRGTMTVLPVLRACASLVKACAGCISCSLVFGILSFVALGFGGLLCLAMASPWIQKFFAAHVGLACVACLNSIVADCN